MYVAKVCNRRFLAQTDLHTLIAAGRKRAALRRIQHINRRSLDRDKTLMLLTVHARNAADQPLGVLVLRVIENIVRCAVLHNISGIHNRDVVAHARHHAEVVRDHHDRHAKLILQIHHQLQDLRLNGHIERRRRLVRDQKLRLARQSDRDHHTLAHTAGQLVRILLQTLLRLIDPDKLQKLLRALLYLFLALIGVEPDHLADLVADRVDRIQARHRVLEDDGDFISTHLLEFLFGHTVDAVAV